MLIEQTNFDFEMPMILSIAICNQSKLVCSINYITYDSIV
jgi:hypothetical protein